MEKRIRGFTLMELMITLAIIGIITAVAMPSYQSYVRKGRRADTQQFMLTLAQLNQRYFLDNRAYASTASTLTTVPTSVSSYYTVSITVDAGPPQTFSISAAPSTTDQQHDTCGTLTVTNTGAKSSSSGTNCW